MQIDTMFDKVLEIYQPIHDFFNSMWVQIIIKGFLIYFFLIWIALIIWVTKDIVNRSKNIFVQVFSILLVTLLNIFGLILYLIIRPSKTLKQRYIEEIEKKMFLDTMSDYYNCTKCGTKIEKDFNFCPSCGTSSKTVCKHCGQKVMVDWKICPYCKSEIKIDEPIDDKGKKHFGAKIQDLIKK